MPQANNNNDNPPAGTQPPAGVNGGNNGAGAGNGGNANDTPKVFTQADVDKILGTRLSEQEERLTKKFTETLDAKLTEASNKAKMTVEEQQKAEFDKQTKELEAGKVQLAIGQNLLNATKKLAELKAPVEFADYLVTADAKETGTRLETFAQLWQKAISDGIKSGMAGQPPKDLNNQGKTPEGKPAKNYF